MTRLICILLTLMQSTLVLALGRVVAYEEVSKYHFSSIQSINNCGSWRVGEVVGDFRLILVYLAGQDMLFIDMVHPNSSGSELVLKKGFTFPEINNDHSEISLRNIQCAQISDNQIQVIGEAISSHDDIPYQFKVLVNAETGIYEFKKLFSNNAPNSDAR